MTKVDWLSGVSPVLATPFHPDETVDLRSFGRQLEALAALGVRSVMFPGFASEFFQLSDDERQRLMDELLTMARTVGVAVIASVSANSTRVAVTQAKAVASRGASAINVLPPHAMAPPTEAVREHLITILAAVPETPVILQYVPHETATRLAAEEVLSLAREHANLRVVKAELRSPADYIKALLQGDPQVHSLVGNGGVDLLPALRAGAVGVQPGCGFVEIYLWLWHYWSTGDHAAARRVYERLVPYLNDWLDAGRLILVSKIVAWRRGEIASATCRRPHAPLGAASQAAIDDFLTDFADELATSPPVATVRPAPVP